MRVLTLLGLSALLPAATAAPLFAQSGDAPVPGYALTTLPVAAPTNPDGPFGTIFGLARTLANGDVITFDGETVARVQADGTPVATLAVLGGDYFPGAFAIDPSETFAIVGESSNHDVFKVDLAGGGASLLTTLTNNFDAVFEDADHVVISANLGGGFADNDLVRVNVQDGSTETLAQLDGPSGPVAFDAFGNLLYATQSLVGDPADVLLWTAAQVEAAVLTATPLTELDAFVLAGGFPGLADLVLDPDTGALYGAEVDWSTGTNRLIRVQIDPANSPTLLNLAPWNAPSTLEFVPATSVAAFLGYQPGTGGTLRYGSTDFFSFTERNELRPARPALSLSGSGTVGVGRFDFNVTGAMAGGSFHVFYGPSSTWNPVESATLLPGLAPLVSGLDPATAVALPTPYGLDGNGDGTAGFVNAAGVVGAVATQALCFDLATFEFAMSEVAFL